MAYETAKDDSSTVSRSIQIANVCSFDVVSASLSLPHLFSSTR